MGQQVHSFSYAHGSFNPEIKKLVKEAGYKLAVATRPGNKFANDDLFTLKRIRISENGKNLLSFWFKTSGYYNSLKRHRHK